MRGGHAAARTVAYAGVGENARVPAYTVNEDAVRHAKRLIDARRYVLRSRWQDVQPRAREQNAFLKTHSWQEYAAWHLGLTEGADEEAKARYAFVYGDFRRLHRIGLIACHYRAAEMAAQGDRAGRTRAPAVPRPKERLTCPRVPARPKMYPSRTRDESDSRRHRQHNMPVCRAFLQTSDGLEPSTPSLPSGRNGFLLEPVSGLMHLPPVATGCDR
jgi:hypothetical protein